MKKFLLILVLFLAIDTCYLQSGWVLQKSGINGFIEGISCVDNQNCWAMGIGDSSGTIILHTTNGGDSWEIQFDEFVYPEQSGLYVQGNLIDFYDLNNGFFGGGWDSYLTSDGGKNWIHIHINYADNTSDGCEEVKYINNHTIWSISDGGSVIKSTDAGDTWEVCLNQSIMWNSLYILDSLNGWVTPGPSVFFTSDGGKNWVERIDTNHFVWGYDMAFTDINTGWLTGAVGQLYNTTDGGNTWNESQLDTSQDFLKQVYFTDKNHGWVLAEVRPDEKTTILYRTTDGGQNWHLDTTFPNEYINKIEFSDSLNSWAVGMDGHIWHTTNGGFTSVAENDHPSKSAIFSISPNPASDFLKVSSANIIGKEISIYSMLGNKLISVIAERRETKINIETLPIGVYLIKIENRTQLFVKE